jgi:hypothetical protein
MISFLILDALKPVCSRLPQFHISLDYLPDNKLSLLKDLIMGADGYYLKALLLCVINVNSV